MIGSICRNLLWILVNWCVRLVYWLILCVIMSVSSCCLSWYVWLGVIVFLGSRICVGCVLFVVLRCWVLVWNKLLNCWYLVIVICRIWVVCVMWCRFVCRILCSVWLNCNVCIVCFYSWLMFVLVMVFWISVWFWWCWLLVLIEYVWLLFFL